MRHNPQNLSLDSAHTCATPDAVGMAAFNDHHRGGPCSPWSHALTRGRWGLDHRRCRDGWDQPSPCLYMGAAVSGARRRGLGRPTRPRFPARAAPSCPAGAARGQRMMRLPDEVSMVEGDKFREAFHHAPRGSDASEPGTSAGWRCSFRRAKVASPSRLRERLRQRACGSRAPSRRM